MISNTSGHPLREDWDDLRMILAVAEAGSVSAAARGLGVNHATVLRRIAAFERATGIELFDKTARGYTVPEDRQRIVEAIGEVDAAIQSNLKETVTRVLASLTPREERVLRMRFGIGMNTDHTLEEVGQQFSVTRERIRQIEAKALRKLKHPSRSRKMRSFLDQ